MKRVMPPLHVKMTEKRKPRRKCGSNAPDSEVAPTQYQSPELPGWVYAREKVLRIASEHETGLSSPA